MTYPTAIETLATTWERAPAQVSLAREEVHVWLGELDGVESDVLGTLSTAERARAACFPQPLKGRRWAAARASLRVLLAAYTGAPAASLEIIFSPDGKPSLRTGPRFNLAHAGRLALYAFSAAGAVGVDVELARERRVDVTRLAARAFGPSQAERLEALPAAARERELLRLWTQREARIKCFGTAAQAARRQPWVAALELGGAAAGALAVEKEPCAVRCYRLSNSSSSPPPQDSESISPMCQQRLISGPVARASAPEDEAAGGEEVAGQRHGQQRRAPAQLAVGSRTP